MPASAGGARAAVPAAAPGDRGVLAWGHSFDYVPPEETPVVMTGLGPGSQVVAVAAGGAHSVVLRSDGSVVAWGINGRGQLGNGHPSDGEATPVDVSGLGPRSGVVAVAAGREHSLVLRADGEVLAWGLDDHGQLGDGGANQSRSTPTRVSGLGPGSGAVAVAAGGTHSMALLTDGSVLAWGDGCCAPFGDVATFDDRPTPVPVSGLGAGSGVVEVDAGEFHSLARRADGSVVAWGSNLGGQLGTGAGHSAYTPVAVGGLGPGSGVVDVTAGGNHNLAVRSDGAVLAWGGSAYGALGAGQNRSEEPAQVIHLGPGSGVVRVSAGANHSLALRSDGSVLGWGWDIDGQVGDVGQVPERHRPAPVPVTGLGAGSGVTAIDAGSWHSLAVSSFDQGYALVAGDGGVFTFGWAGFFGSAGGLPLNRPMVGMAYTPSARGYWLVAADGGIFAYGDARFLGSTGGVPLNRPIVGMERTASGNGYWLVASDGGVFAFGDAGFLGSTGGIPLNQPIVDMERTPLGDGYWLAAADGGIFAFGAAFHGSAAGIPLSAPVVGMSRTATGAGYHLVEATGATVPFGDAPSGFLDPVTSPSAGSGGPVQTVVGIMPTPLSGGYWLCAASGRVEPSGDAKLLGGTAGTPLVRPIVGCEASLNLSG